MLLRQRPRTNLLDDVRRALSLSHGPEAEAALTAALAGRHAAEIVEVMDKIPLHDVLVVFSALDDAHAADTLDELDPETVRYVTAHAPHERIARLLDRLPMDDAAEIVAEADRDRAEVLLGSLGAIAPNDAAEVRKLLAYPDHSAGRLMTDKFARVPAVMAAADVLNYLRDHAYELETINVVYVVDSDLHLQGCATIREVLVAEPKRAIGEFMTADPISVSPVTDQQDAALVISRYDLLALPVTDKDGRMLGIVTIDDTIDILVHEFDEDLLRSVGSDAEELERKSSVQIALLRMPWIMATMLIELMAGVVIHIFDGTLTKFILLASFMPIISAISGNTGLQSAAIIIRGLSSGQVQLANWRHALSRQVGTTLILGAACAIVLGLIAAIWDKHVIFGIVVFLGMFVAVNIAGIVGTVVPLLSKRAGFDPALTAGPFETAFQDVIGISIFLGLATVLLRVLG